MKHFFFSITGLPCCPELSFLCLTLLYSCVVFLLFPIKAQVTVTLQVAGFMFCVGFCVAFSFLWRWLLASLFHTEMSQLRVLLYSAKRSLSCRSLSGNIELRSGVSLQTPPRPLRWVCALAVVARRLLPSLCLSVCVWFAHLNSLPSPPLP